MSRMDRIVIVGAGLAALRAAERLRELKFDGELVIIGDEPHKPYHRPALSKQLITGKLTAKDLLFPAYQELDAIWRTRTRAQRLDPGRHVVHLPGGEDLRYDGLVIATGVEARHLAGAPRHDPRVHTLRTLDDAMAIKANLTRTKGRVVVVGTGFTGCEMASSCRDMNRDVTIIGRSKTLFGKALGPELGAAIGDLHRRHGVDLALGVDIRHWATGPEGVAIVLSSERLLTASCVVLAVGTMPTVDWLTGSGLVLEDGVLCEPTCHVVGATDMVAAGDVARWPNLRFDGVPRRVEHWLNAIEMGRAAAESLLAGKARAKPFTPLPRFWSEQHHVRIQAAGIPAIGQQTMYLSTRPNGADRSITGYIRAGKPVGIVGLNQPRTMIHLTRQLDQKLRPMVPSERVRTSRRAAAQTPAERSRTEATSGSKPGGKIDVNELSARIKAPASLKNGR
ncbi:ferredoxin reductase [Kutzneria albida DSM 43870]|uniref:Ferredoxin reductase n=2 Tax=Kutzneria TaxID=43356 RepID=W5W321_9PSEU|nr:ferredoxin reductase [Kutzneria albida DSM 43870]